MDHWLFYSNNKCAINLLKVEEIKRKLSSPEIKYENKYPIKLITQENKEKEFQLSKSYLKKS